MDKGRGKRMLWGGLTILMGTLFLLDIAIPDPVPLVDEIGTGLLTVIAAIKTLKEFWAKARPTKLPNSADKGNVGDGP
jgi:hypothetical protein